MELKITLNLPNVEYVSFQFKYVRNKFLVAY